MKNWGGLISTAVFAAVAIYAAIYALATGELRSALTFAAVAVIGAVALILTSSGNDGSRCASTC